jgi:hypothetical protein
MLVMKRDKFESFVRQMDLAYSKIEVIDDPYIKSTVKLYTSRARLLTKFNFSLGFVISCFFCFYPILAGNNLPYGIWIPGVDVYVSPNYEIVYILQVSA